MEYKYVYGPVPSRRLGRSLGVNPIPSKTCNYSCIYCQLGRTDHMTNKRQDFFPPEEIIKEIESVTTNKEKIDYITLVGEGEPTLCKSIGKIIQSTKKLTDIPVAVITNGALLSEVDVRSELISADVVMPSLDAADQKTFERINRPIGRMQITKIIQGMVEFRKQFNGELWLEVMLVEGVNDSEEHLVKLSHILKEISPDRTYINIPIRPPAEPWVKPPDKETIAKAHAIIGGAVSIAYQEEGEFKVQTDLSPVKAILEIIKRHPMRKQQIEHTLKEHFDINTDKFFKELEATSGVIKKEFEGNTFYYSK